jgi:hypothetical protein
MAKFPGSNGGDGDVPVDTYTLTREASGAGAGGGAIFCNCPAAQKGYGRNANLQTCKHVNWLERWRKIFVEHKAAPGTPLYYDSGRDAFYPVDILREP